MGRRPIDQQAGTMVVCPISLPPRHHEFLGKYAKMTRRSLSEVVRQLIRDGLPALASAAGLPDPDAEVMLDAAKENLASASQAAVYVLAHADPESEEYATARAILDASAKSKKRR